MSITVSDLLELPIFKNNGKLVTNCGLNNKVQYMTVMEAPDFHYDGLDDHVFILTTLSAHHNSLEDINTVIKELCEAKVSAIAIKLGRFIDAVDSSTAEIASKYGVPIITLSSNVFFREVLSEALSVIADNQRITINLINEMNREVFDAILRNRSIIDLLGLMCKKIPCYCCCYSASGEMMAEVSSIKQDIDPEAIMNNIKELNLVYKDGNKNNYIRKGKIITFPCVAQEELLGTLSIAFENEFSDLVLPLAETLVNALGVKFLEDNIKLRTEREMTASILDDILFSNNSDEATAKDRLSLLNFIPYDNHMLVIITRNDPEYKKINEHLMLSTIQSAFSSRFDSALVFKRGSEYIALLSCKQKNLEKTAAHISKCQDEVSLAIGQKMDFGCSISVNEFGKMSECYKQAKRAIRYGRMINPDNNVFMYNDYFEMGLISRGVGSSDSYTFFNRIIDPIKNYDCQYNGELWLTLESCFMEGTPTRAAERLFIHVSTLRYRLQKIESLTGYNFFSINDRMTLYLAYLLYKVSDIER
ncbi:MAG: PucR family transcriptional regulator ligand-binding domain-containing protein [Ruminiclostridium sp.]|nr:PucR family transcriptional regulator ligand-binding domain-containing protein [Ruminiclostridium sp.]